MKMKKPNKQAMLDFLSAGVKMMETEATRELLKDRKAVPHAGHKLIELQRAQWPILGFDADIGCKALDEIDGKDEGNKVLLAERSRFMQTAMRTYLQAIKDRRPAVLEKKKPLPRAMILEFFDACNTRMDLPETKEALLKHLTTECKVPNELIIDMQTQLLEDLGYEKEHGCAMLSRVPQDFPNDAEVHQKMQMWKMKASQTCMAAVKAHQDAGGELPQLSGMPQVDPQLAKEMEAFVPKARDAVANMSMEEKSSFFDEKRMKKLQVFQNLPPEGRVAYVQRLGSDEKLEFMKMQMIAADMMRRGGYQAQAQPNQAPAACTMDAVQGPSTAPAQEQMM